MNVQNFEVHWQQAFLLLSNNFETLLKGDVGEKKMWRIIGEGNVKEIEKRGDRKTKENQK